MMALRISVTGGMFNNVYNELTGEFYFKDTHIPGMLELGRYKADLHIQIQSEGT